MPYVVKLHPLGGEFISPDFESKEEAKAFIDNRMAGWRSNGQRYPEHGMPEGYYSSAFIGRIPLSRLRPEIVWEEIPEEEEE